MEVKEAIERLKGYTKSSDDTWLSPDEAVNIISLLKSLETTIKGYETVYTKAVLEKDLLEKELEAYKGIINTLHRYCDWFQVKGTSSITGLNNLLEDLEQKYLGGWE